VYSWLTRGLFPKDDRTRWPTGIYWSFFTTDLGASIDHPHVSLFARLSQFRRGSIITTDFDEGVHTRVTNIWRKREPGGRFTVQRHTLLQ
jgi:hypothetical protein